MKQSDSSPRSRGNNSDPDKYFEELRKENYDNTFQQVEVWLRNSSIKLSNKNSERKFSNMKNYFSAHKFRLAYTFLILAFVVAACNYPVTQQETVSDVLTWSVSKDNTDAVNKISSLDWFKNSEYNYKNENINGQERISYSMVIPIENLNKVEDFRNQLRSIPGMSEIKLTPISETVKRPVYSAVLNGIFKIDINASNMSNDELSQEVDRQLKNAGIEAATVNFEKDSDGKRVIRLIIPDDQLNKEGGFDVTIKDGNNVSRLKEFRKEGPDGGERFKGKSDKEIRDMVRQDVDKDLKDDQIEIVRKGENVMVKIKRFDKNNEIETENEIR